MSLYTSELAARALNLPPLGKPWEGAPHSCAMCGRPVLKGTPAVDLKIKDTFTNLIALVPSNALCGWCAVTTGDQAVMRHLQRALVSAEGCFPLSKDTERAWLFLTPPAPPFAVVIQSGMGPNTLHLHWRTPVTVDKDLIYLRLDERVLMIRRPVLLDAMQWCETVARAIDEEAPKSRRPKKIKPGSTRHHPFVRLDRDAKKNRHGALLPAALALQKHPDLIHRLQHLWAGELWALATLAKLATPTPEAPIPVTSVKSKPSTQEE